MNITDFNGTQKHKKTLFYLVKAPLFPQLEHLGRSTLNLHHQTTFIRSHISSVLFLVFSLWLIYLISFLSFALFKFLSFPGFFAKVWVCLNDQALVIVAESFYLTFHQFNFWVSLKFIAIIISCLCRVNQLEISLKSLYEEPTINY